MARLTGRAKSKARRAASKAKSKSSSSSKSSSTKKSSSSGSKKSTTRKPKETVSQTVARANTMLASMNNRSSTKTPVTTPTRVPSPPTSTKATKTSVGTESVSQTVERAKRLLGDAYIPPPTTPANTISAENLTSNNFKAPPTTTPTGFAGLIESSKASITDLTPEVERGAEEIKGVFDVLGGQESRRQDELIAAGVPEKQAAYSKIVNIMNQKDLASRRRVEKIMGENVTGRLEEGQTIAIRAEEIKHASEMADLAIVAAFAKDDYELALSIVNDKIDAETEDLNNELKGLQFFYSENFNELSDERRTALLQQTAEVEREIADKESNLKQIGAIQLAAAENGANAATISAIGKSEDITGAITAAGSYIDETIDRDPGSAGPSVVDLSPEDKRILTGAGFSGREISDLQKSVAEFGIEATLEQISDQAQLIAVKKVYNVGEALKTRADVESKVEEVGVKEILEILYEPDELKKFADEAGVSKWYKLKGFNLKNYYKSDDAKNKAIEAYIQKYKKEGIYSE